MSVTLHTNLGDLKIEIFCESVPKTAENFLALCASGYYNGSPFHRLVAGFMAQTGMPAGDGSDAKDGKEGRDKGTSIWGEAFADEIRLPALRHHSRGIVSMANKGPNTNGSQFFVTFARASHLDGANTVFGHLLGDASFATLDRLEAVPVDKKHRPLAGKAAKKAKAGGGEGETKNEKPQQAPRIESVTIHANPLAR